MNTYRIALLAFVLGLCVPPALCVLSVNVSPDMAGNLPLVACWSLPVGLVAAILGGSYLFSQ